MVSKYFLCVSRLGLLSPFYGISKVIYHYLPLLIGIYHHLSLFVSYSKFYAKDYGFTWVFHWHNVYFCSILPLLGSLFILFCSDRVNTLPISLVFTMMDAFVRLRSGNQPVLLDTLLHSLILFYCWNFFITLLGLGL